MPILDDIVIQHVYTDVFLDHKTHTYYIESRPEIDNIMSVTGVVCGKTKYCNALMKTAAEVGQEVHNAYHAIQNKPHMADDELMGLFPGASKENVTYLANAINDTMDQVKAIDSYDNTLIQSEKSFVAEYDYLGRRLFVGGTADEVAISETDYPGVSTARILELKTTNKASPRHLVQLSAYCMMQYYASLLEEGKDRDVTGVLSYINANNPSNIKLIKFDQIKSTFYPEFLLRLLGIIADHKGPIDYNRINKLLAEYATEAKKERKKDIERELISLASLSDLYYYRTGNGITMQIQRVFKSPPGLHPYPLAYIDKVSYNMETRISITGF